MKVEGCDINDWVIDRPQSPDEWDKLTFKSQVTAPMPLEGIQDLISSVAEGVSDIDRSTESSLLVKDGYVLVTKEHFRHLNVNNDKLTDDVLGFFSLLLSYIKIDGDVVSTSGSPKQLVNIMPRTYWTNIYAQVKDKAPVPPEKLLETVQQLACFRNDCEGKGGVSYVFHLSFYLGTDLKTGSTSSGATGPTRNRILRPNLTRKS